MPVRVVGCAILVGMDLRSLEYFVAVAEEESFTRAAQRCYVTQPTISAQIQTLERELGEPLFDRTPRGILLTEGGRLLLPYARRALSAVDDAAGEFSARSALLRGHLRVGSGGGIENTAVPVLLGRFRTNYPGIDVHLTEATSAPLLAMVLDGELHAAVIARTDSPPPPAISWAPMFTDRLVAVFDADQFRIVGDPVSLTELADHPIITYPTSSALRGRVDAVAERDSVPLRVNYVANDVRMQVALARQRVGIALCARTDPSVDEVAPLTVREIAPQISFEKVLIWRNDIAPSAPLRAFLSLWRDHRGQAPATPQGGLRTG